MFNEDRLSHSRPFLRKINSLNVYQTNLYQHLKKPVHKYRTNFSKSNFCLKNVFLNSKKYSIYFRGPKLWNEILRKEEKELKSYSFFQNIIKAKLLMIENQSKHF